MHRHIFPMTRATYTEGGRAFAAGVARRLADDVAEHVVDEVGVVDVAVVVTSPLGLVDLLTLHLALHLLPLLLLHHLLVDARQPLLHARTHARSHVMHSRHVLVTAIRFKTIRS